MLKRKKTANQNIVEKMPKPSIPRTTPECERLRSMVIEGLKSNIFDTQKKEAARVALKRLRKNRCVKSIEYIIQVTGGGSPSILLHEKYATRQRDISMN